jgi:aromatic-L-amino-acid/L-tryptophan decarboxylase
MGGIERPQLPDIEFDWDASTWRRIGERAVDLVIEASSDWDHRRPAPAASPSEVLDRFQEPVPEAPVSLDVILARLKDDVIPLSTYNGHPSFYGYITSSPNPVGVVGDFITSAINANTSIWRAAPAATAIELQTIGWLKELLKLPASTEGVFSSGGQFANVLAHAVIRDHKASWDVRQEGLRGANGAAPRLTTYVSDQAHYCHEQAAEFLGLGRESMRLVPSDETYRIRLDSLARMIREDRSRSWQPIAIVANAGTIGTGAVDPIPELAQFARDEGLWLHVDGAYGAFAILSDSAPASLHAIGEADSIACDPHKWLFAPIDAAVTLVRNAGLLKKSFQIHASYLQQRPGDGRVDLVEYSPENSRRLRALKVWLALQAYGAEGYRKMIERNLLLAQYLEGLVQTTPGLRLAAPRELSIVCWRVEPASPALAPEELNQLQAWTIEELEKRGIALVSNAQLHGGRAALRACIVNFRTGCEDVERLVAASARIGLELAERIRARESAASGA